MLFARATVWFDWGRLREAYTGFLQAEAAGVTRVCALSQHGMVVPSARVWTTTPNGTRGGRSRASPANVAAHFGLGAVLHQMKRYPEAIASFERVLEFSPDHAQAVAGIAQCKLEQQDYAGAEGWMRRAVALAPDSPQFLINLAVAIANQERYDESLDVLRRAAELEAAQGAPPVSMIDTGFALVSMGRYVEALELFRRGLPQLPDPRAHGYYAFLLLVLGRLREGWVQYEFRWMQDPHLSKRPVCPQPQWAGQDLAGKTILVLDEQGAGDIIHFARFVRLLKAMGARRAPARSSGDGARSLPDLRASTSVSRAAELPPEFDYHIHLMSIPHVLGIGTGRPFLRTFPTCRLTRPRREAWAGANPRKRSESRIGMGRKSEISSR